MPDAIYLTRHPPNALRPPNHAEFSAQCAAVELIQGRDFQVSIEEEGRPAGTSAGHTLFNHCCVIIADEPLDH